MCYNLAYMEKKLQNYAERYNKVLPDNAIRQAIQDELDIFYFVSGFIHPQLPITSDALIF